MKSLDIINKEIEKISTLITFYETFLKDCGSDDMLSDMRNKLNDFLCVKTDLLLLEAIELKNNI